MNMTFATSLYPATGKRPIFKIINPFTCNAATRRNFTVRRNFSCSATVATDITARVSEFEIENKKNDLLRLVQDTQRGLVTTPDQRSSIEEALVSLEGYNMGESVDMVRLDGTWRLQYTSAPDVLVLFESAARFPFFQVVKMKASRYKTFLLIATQFLLKFIIFFLSHLLFFYKIAVFIPF